MMNLWLVLLAEYQLIYHDHIFFSSLHLVCCCCVVQFLKIYILLGSVATRFGCGGIFNGSLSGYGG